MKQLNRCPAGYDSVNAERQAKQNTTMSIFVRVASMNKNVATTWYVVNKVALTKPWRFVPGKLVPARRDARNRSLIILPSVFESNADRSTIYAESSVGSIVMLRNSHQANTLHFSSSATRASRSSIFATRAAKKSSDSRVYFGQG
jgi:hypothetical protein